MADGLTRANRRAATDIPPIVLLLDDQAETLEVFDGWLSRRGYWVARAVNGPEALERAHDLQPDAVIAAVGLPDEMDGTDLIRQLRADRKLRDVPVLVVTDRDPRDLPSFTGLVVAGLLVTPVAPKTLVDTIDRILQSRPRKEAPAFARGRLRYRTRVDAQRVTEGCRQSDNRRQFVKLRLQGRHREAHGRDPSRLRPSHRSLGVPTHPPGRTNARHPSRLPRREASACRLNEECFSPCADGVHGPGAVRAPWGSGFIGGSALRS